MLVELKESKDVVFKSLTTNLKHLLVKVGYVKKAHGIKGEILLEFDSGEWPFVVSSIYIQPKDTNLQNAQKHDVVQSRSSQKGLIIQLKNCNDRTQAEFFQGHEVYIENKQLQSQKGEFLYLNELLFFTVYQRKHKDVRKIGIVNHFISSSKQDYLVVQTENHRSIEIPFVTPYIVDILFDHKKIFLQLPEGFPGVDQ